MWENVKRHIRRREPVDDGGGGGLLKTSYLFSSLVREGLRLIVDVADFFLDRHEEMRREGERTTQTARRHRSVL